MIPSHLIPQANDPERLVELARHVAQHGAGSLPPGFADRRDQAYFRSALRMLGWVDEEGAPTSAARLITDDLSEQRGALLSALERSPLGAAWIARSGLNSLADADLDGVANALADLTLLSPSTCERRASTLRRWLRWCRGLPLGRARRGDQLGLFLGAGENVAESEPELPWPAPTRFPHNEAKHRVERMVENDLADPGDVLIVTGYASLDRVVRLLGARDFSVGGALRILFGNEPFVSNQTKARITVDSLADEVRDYWLERGISVLRAADVIAAQEAVARQAVEMRIASSNRGIHAKMFCSDRGVTVGSSNYTPNGMARQSEANTRFEPGHERFQEARDFAEGLWELGQPYSDAFAELLESLLRAVSWQEALARACAEVLEGEWARRAVPPDELDQLEPPLWPHQLQGISQAVWILHNLGSVLVADATGSGKTRMGAWLLRAAFDRQIRGGHGRRVQPVVIAPPPIVGSWKDWLQECGLRWSVDSHGPLSNAKSLAHKSLVKAIAETELLAVDEAHNFLNSSERTRRLRTHYADNAVLFTATPINRGASDLLSLVELLGPDNFPDEALDTLQKLVRLRRSGAARAEESDREAIREQIRQFMVRRTRRELNRIVDAVPDAYRMPGRRAARYPHHRANYFAVNATENDLRRAGRIVELADQLKGVARLGGKLELPRSLAIDGMSEADYLARVIKSVAALAHHFVLDCLRSSRIALFEHIHGTQRATEELAAGLDLGKKTSTGDTIGTLRSLEGRPPEWRFEESLKTEAPAWAWEPEAHAAACREDELIYEEIGELVRGMSDARESAKLRHLAELVARRGLVIAYDSHVLSLKLFERGLEDLGVQASLFTGDGGQATKRRAVRQLGLDSSKEQLVALCTDAFSEGMNLQKASVVVHLDTPTVIRTAEQRAGRVDRMDSPHDDVEIWWPRDQPGFAPRRKELLRERHEVVSDLIGANLQMPEQDAADIVAVEDLAHQADLERDEEDPRSLYDAFRPVRSFTEDAGLVGPQIYEAMRTSQAEIVACVSLVRSAATWGFFAVGGLGRVAPRWIFLDSIDGTPETDLGRIATELRRRLSAETPDHPIDANAESAIAALTARLQARERSLLPMRRRRALELADRVLPEWRSQAFADGDRARLRLLQRLMKLFAPHPDEGEHPDPRALADAWLTVVRPVQREAMARSRRWKRLWRLDDLYKPLVAAPVATSTLERAFREIPLLPPVTERVVAMIVGVPSASASR